MQFAVIAHDADDEDAPARRAEVRPSHLSSIQRQVEAGNILLGGALLDDDERMIGSIVIAEFDSRADLDAWLRDDPYVTQGVWNQIEIQPFRAAVGTWVS